MLKSEGTHQHKSAVEECPRLVRPKLEYDAVGMKCMECDFNGFCITNVVCSVAYLLEIVDK